MKIKSQKGSVVLFVLVAMLFFIIYLVTLYTLTSNDEATTYASTRRIKEIYEQDLNNLDDVYETLIQEQNQQYNGYIQKDLIAYYDLSQTKGVQNNILKDLSNNENDGTIDGATLINGALHFDGINDIVSLKQLDYSNVTIETVIEYEQIPENNNTTIIGNFKNGGYGITNYSAGGSTNFNKFTINVNGSYYSAVSNNEIKANNKYFLSGSYDGSNIVLYENGDKTSTNIAGTIKSPDNNTIIKIGISEEDSAIGNSYFNGKIEAIRIYNRALTDEEVQHNYELDLIRFK